jgi:hypothetical protein
MIFRIFRLRPCTSQQLRHIIVAFGLVPSLLRRCFCGIRLPLIVVFLCLWGGRALNIKCTRQADLAARMVRAGRSLGTATVSIS